MQGAVCGDRVYKMERRMMVKLRGGTAELRIETGRWCGLSIGESFRKGWFSNTSFATGLKTLPTF